MAGQFLVAVLLAAVVSIVAAQDNAICNSTSAVNLNSSADSNQITSCQSVSGIIYIDAPFQGALSLPQLVNAAGLETDAQFVQDGTNGTLTGLSLPVLQNCKTIQVHNNPLFTSADIPNLRNSSIINFGNLWNLASGLNFSQLGPSLDQAVYLHQMPLDGLNVYLFNTSVPYIILGSMELMQGAAVPKGPTLGKDLSIAFNNNAKLNSTIICAANIYQIRILGSKSIVLNGTSVAGIGGFQIEACEDLAAPNLAQLVGITTLANNTFSTIDFPSLTTVANGTFDIFSNSELNDLNLPALTSIGQNINLYNNSKLSNINLPALTTVGGNLTFAGNGPNQTISFDHLQTVNGIVNITGDIISVNMPLLAHAFLNFTITSTNPGLNCSAFDRFVTLVFIRGTYKCSGPNSASSTSTTVPTSAPTGNESTTSNGTTIATSSNELTTGAKAGIGVGVSLGVIVAALVVFLLARRRKSKKAAKIKQQEEHHEEHPEEDKVDFQVAIPELGQGKHHDTTELASPVIPQEIAGPIYYELPTELERNIENEAVEGRSELLSPTTPNEKSGSIFQNEAIEGHSGLSTPTTPTYPNEKSGSIFNN